MCLLNFHANKSVRPSLHISPLKKLDLANPTASKNKHCQVKFICHGCHKGKSFLIHPVPPRRYIVSILRKKRNNKSFLFFQWEIFASGKLNRLRKQLRQRAESVFNATADWGKPYFNVPPKMSCCVRKSLILIYDLVQTVISNGGAVCLPKYNIVGIDNGQFGNIYK